MLMAVISEITKMTRLIVNSSANYDIGHQYTLGQVAIETQFLSGHEYTKFRIVGYAIPYAWAPIQNSATKRNSFFITENAGSFSVEASLPDFYGTATDLATSLSTALTAASLATGNAYTYSVSFSSTGTNANLFIISSTGSFRLESQTGLQQGRSIYPICGYKYETTGFATSFTGSFPVDINHFFRTLSLNINNITKDTYESKPEILGTAASSTLQESDETIKSSRVLTIPVNVNYGGLMYNENNTSPWFAINNLSQKIIMNIRDSEYRIVDFKNTNWVVDIEFA